tara:strand:- start:110 stop:526 length:417 start_codon:yes stop_codon:yes gene_type:complete
MFNFLKKKKKILENPIKNIAALLIHAAKIDENYTNKEREMIKRAINELDPEAQNIEKTLLNAEELEKNSNQILNFTREVKNLDKNLKIKIIEILWKIIYSDNNPDMYENNLMRRLTGLLYLDPKVVGDIKEKVINDLK